MKFKLTTSGTFYSESGKKEFEKLGFTFKRSEDVYKDYSWVTRWAGSQEYYMNYGSVEIEINSLEELLAFAREWGDIIIDGDNNELEIYNDYRE